MRNMRLAMLWVAGLALGPQAVLADIPVSFDHDGVILWTRITPRTVNETTASYEVTWTVYSGDELSTVVQTGVANTSAERDFTVKVDVSGLESGPQYAFRFQVAHIVSDVGTFR
ncbi:hypothetical protein ABBQ38_011069 [Trebouxia sp. C0009 RCD-2024]